MGKTSVIGLDIGTFAVRAVELTSANGKPVVTRMGQITLPDGAVVDGEVADVTAVAGALSRLWDEVGFKSRDVIVGVTGPRVIIRQAQVTAMAEEDLRAGLRYQAQELLPIPVDDTHLDVAILDREEAPADGEGDPKMTILLAAAQNEVVAPHVAALEAAGLKAVAIDALPMALLRACPPQRPDGTEALVSIGAGLTTIVVREAGIARFVRVLAVGGSDITSAIEADLGCDMAYAEHLKRQAAIDGGAHVATLSRAGAMLQEHVRPLVEEIRGSFDYYLAQSHVDELDVVALTGGGVNTWGLVTGLQSSLAASVFIADPFASVQVGDTGLTPEDVRRAGPFMAGAIGLALGGMDLGDGALRINLLPQELVVARRRRRQTTIAVAGVACFAVALGGVSALQLTQVASARSAAGSEEAQVEQLNGQIAQLAPVSQAQDDLRSREQVVRLALSDDVDYIRMVQQVAATMPNDVWLSSFTAQKGATAATPGTVTMSVSGLSEDAVVRWVRQVSGVPALGSLWVPTTSKNGDVVVFNSTATITPDARSDRAVKLTGRAS